MAGHLPHHEKRSRFAVEAMTYGDVQQTAQLHISYLPTGFFPQLGHGYVRRWHRTFIDSPTGIALVIRDPDGCVAAFLLGTTDQHAYVRDVLEHDRLALAWRGATGLLLRPSLARRFVNTRAKRYARRLTRGGRGHSERFRTKGPERSTAVDDAKDLQARLAAPVSIGVVHAIVTRPTSRGAGYGRALLRRYESELALAGTRLGQLVTGADGGAPDFYRRLGWRETVRRSDRDGREIIQFDHVVGEQ